MEEKQTYTVTATRTWEIDFSEEEEEMIKQQTGRMDVGEAIEEVVLEGEKKHVQPEEKLIDQEVIINGPSDD